MSGRGCEGSIDVLVGKSVGERLLSLLVLLQFECLFAGSHKGVRGVLLFFRGLRCDVLQDLYLIRQVIDADPLSQFSDHLLDQVHEVNDYWSSQSKQDYNNLILTFYLLLD